MCDVLGVLGIFCGIPRQSLMHLYKCFRFSEIMDQMFLTGRGGVQGSFRATITMQGFTFTATENRKPNFDVRINKVNGP